MNEKELKEKLKQELPFGYIKLITDKLKESGISYSRSTISTVLNPQNKNWNILIINAAYGVVLDAREKNTPLVKKIADL